MPPYHHNVPYLVMLTIADRQTDRHVADVLNSQHAGTGATWRISTKIIANLQAWAGHIVPASRTACLAFVSQEAHY